MRYARLVLGAVFAWSLFWLLVAASEDTAYDLAAKIERRFGSLGW